MASNKRKTTFNLDSDTWQRFVKQIEALDLRRDAWLNRVLLDEISYLEQIPPNSESSAVILAALRERRPVTSKVVLTLDRELVDELNRVCREKRVSRDAFLEQYLLYLIDGAENGSCISPLVKAEELLTNPRFEYGSMGESDLAYGALSLTNGQLAKVLDRLEEVKGR